MPLTTTQRGVVLAAVFCSAATAVIALSSVRFVYANPGARVALETAQGMVAVLAAGLVAGRFLESRDRRDLLVVAGLALLAVVAFERAALPALETVVSERTQRSVGRWAPLAGQVVAATAIAAAALSRRVLVRTRRSALVLVGGVMGVAFGIAGVLFVFDDRLPPAIEALGPGNADRPRFDAHPVLVVAYVVLVGLFAAAAWAFAWRTDDREPDSLTHALAIGTVLAAVARVNLLLYPSDSVTYVHIADLFRLGFYVALASGAAVSIRDHWASEAAAAELRTREQLARELHDGLAQELGFIASQVSSLASGRGDPALTDQIAMAAERARNEARRMVDALEGVTARPLRTVLLDAVVPVADRHGAVVHVRGAPGVSLDPRTTHEISQIAREATANGVRHGGARTIIIDLRADQGELQMRVEDDGHGFERSTADHRGFGLRSMEQRALQLGGSLVIRSTPGRGAIVELRAPLDGSPSGLPNERRAAR